MRLEPAGRWALETLDAEGTATGSSDSAAWVATAQLGEERPTWVVSGSSSAEVGDAAAMLGEETLRDHYAVATFGAGEVFGLPTAGEPAGAERRRAVDEGGACLRAASGPAGRRPPARRGDLPDASGGDQLQLFEPARPRRDRADRARDRGGLGCDSSAMAPLRYGLALAFMVVLVNVIVAQRGDTVLLRGLDLPVLGQVDVTLEALAEGCILALRILVALLVFAVWSACVDPDRILKAIRPFAARSALTATLISRLVPLAAADHMRLAEAASLRGPAAAPVGRGALARRLVAGSLDRSVDVAATLELRGFGLPTRPTRVRPRRVHGEIAMLLAGVLTIAAILAAAVSGAGTVETYPSISGGFEPATIGFALAIPLLAAVPFCSPREIRRLRGMRRSGQGRTT